MATEPATEQAGLQGPAAWEQEAEREHVHGARPVAARAAPPAAQQGGARLRRPVRAARAGLPGRAAVGRARGPHDPDGEPPVGHDRGRRRRRRTSSASTACRSGPTWQGEFFLGADPNGRDIMVRLLYGGPQLADDRRGRGADDHDPLDHPGRDRRLLPRLVATCVIRSLLDIIWSFPVVILGVALGVALALGGLKLGPITIAGDSLADPDLHHRAGLRPVHGATRARPGAVAAREGVRGGGSRAGRRAAADHVHRGRAQPRLDDARLLHAADRQRGAAGGGAVVPRRRRAAAQPVVGHDDRRRRGAHRHGAAPGDRARR